MFKIKTKTAKVIIAVLVTFFVLMPMLVLQSIPASTETLTSQSDKTTLVDNSVKTEQEQATETVDEVQSTTQVSEILAETTTEKHINDKEIETTTKPVIESEPTTNQTVSGVSYSVPKVNTSFKSYTYYTSLRTGTPQWSLQMKAYSDENGLRKIEDYYLVAMGTYYSKSIGDLFEITTDKGNVFKVIICDIKADAHTDSTHRYTRANNCMIEFYVDRDNFNSTARSRGSVGILSGFEGSITKVVKIGHYDN